MKKTMAAVGIAWLALFTAHESGGQPPAGRPPRPPAGGERTAPPAAPPEAAPVAPGPSLSGRWVRDAARSEDPLEKLGGRAGRGDRRDRRARGGDPEGGPGRPEGRPTGGERGGPPGGTRASEDGERWRWTERERAAQELTIDHVEPRFAVHDAIGRDWELTIGAPEGEVPLAEGEPVRARAEWKPGGRLTIRWFRPYVGSVVIEEYELVAEGSRLLVHVRSEDDDHHPGLAYQRVYNRAAAPVAEPAQSSDPQAQPTVLPAVLPAVLITAPPAEPRTPSEEPAPTSPPPPDSSNLHREERP